MKSRRAYYTCKNSTNEVTNSNKDSIFKSIGENMSNSSIPNYHGKNSNQYLNFHGIDKKINQNLTTDDTNKYINSKIPLHDSIKQKNQLATSNFYNEHSQQNLILSGMVVKDYNQFFDSKKIYKQKNLNCVFDNGFEKMNKYLVQNDIERKINPTVIPQSSENVTYSNYTYADLQKHSNCDSIHCESDENGNQNIYPESTPDIFIESPNEKVDQNKSSKNKNSVHMNRKRKTSIFWKNYQLSERIKSFYKSTGIYNKMNYNKLEHAKDSALWNMCNTTFFCPITHKENQKQQIQTSDDLKYAKTNTLHSLKNEKETDEINSSNIDISNYYGNRSIENIYDENDLIDIYLHQNDDFINPCERTMGPYLDRYDLKDAMGYMELDDLKILKRIMEMQNSYNYLDENNSLSYRPYEYCETLNKHDDLLKYYFKGMTNEQLSIVISKLGNITIKDYCIMSIILQKAKLIPLKIDHLILNEQEYYNLLSHQSKFNE